MDITADDYRALARSSPWLWRSVQLRRDARPLVTLERPAREVTEIGGVASRSEEEPGSGQALFGWTADGRPVQPEPQWRCVSDIPVERRPDGLVVARPDDSWRVTPSQPMVHGYFSVAAVDPVELADGVDLTEVRAEELRGRETWVARCRALDDYEPRCGCCPLIADRQIAILEWGEERGREMACHESVEIWLDRQTGIMTRWLPTMESGAPDEPIDNEIRWVDGDFDTVWAAAADPGGPPR